MSTAVFDVAIVGFGPSGAVAAATLGQAGLRVLVVDKSHTVYDKPRAVAMDHEIMRVLQGLGVAEAVQAYTEPFSASEHFGADGQMIRRLAMLAPPYPMGWTPSLVFLQPPVEQILRDRVAALPCVDVRLGLELVALAQDGEGVDLQLRGEDGAVEMARARYVIGCDGASSAVRRFSGIGLEDLDFDEPWLVIDVQANAQGLAKLPQASAQFCEPARPVSFIIGTGGHRRWEIMLLPGEDPREMEREEQVWKLLSRWITPDDATLWRRASYRFHALVAKAWRKDCVFIAGDAAHQQPPFLGQGMCQGVRDVTNLAWKLQQVLSAAPGGPGGWRDRLLNTYGEERGAHVRELTATIKGIGRYVCERDLGAARARDARLLADTGGVVKSVPRQDLIPGLQTGCLSQQQHPARGSLFPQPRVLHRGKPVLLDDVAGGGWRVVLGGQAWAWQPLMRGTEVLGMQVLRVGTAPDAGLTAGSWQETEGVLATWFDRHASAAAIVRPDHYVYAMADSASSLDAELVALSNQLATSQPWRHL